MKEFTRNEKLIALLSGIAIFLVIGGYTTNKIFNKNQQVATEIETSTTPEVTIETTTTTPENSTDQYKTAMEKYNDMSVDTFEALPLDERLLLSQYLIDRSVDSGFYDVSYGEGQRAHDFAIEPWAVSQKNNGQEIVDNYLYTNQVSYLQLTIEQNSEVQYDAIRGEKMLSSTFYTVGKNKLVSNSYLEDKAVMETLAKPAHMINKYTATNTSEMLKGTNSNNEAVQYKVVTYYNQDAKTSYARFIYHEFTNYNGSRKAIWLFDTQADTADGLDKLKI